MDIPGWLADRAAKRLAAYDQDGLGRRTWQRDHTVWKPDPEEIANRLGWLDVPVQTQAEVASIRDVAHDVVAAGYSRVVLLGMGGSSLAPEVLARTFAHRDPHPELEVLDATHPAQVRQVIEHDGDGDTLYIVASKSGGTIETLSQYRYFRSRYPDGRRFVAITDGGSKLEATAREEDFFRIFLNDPEIGGRYSALSYFGMVPAALCGVDIAAVLDQAMAMRDACGPKVPGKDNPGAWLGAVLGEAALAGRDKLTIVLPEGLQSLGWWIEQLIAESTGKEGVGILPVEGEAPGPPEVFGEDRIFVAYGEHPWLDAVAEAGAPVIRYPAFEPAGLGAEFFRWEYATAIACQVLGVNPFDQPNVQEAKDATAEVLSSTQEPDGKTPPVDQVLATVRPGDYIALNAFATRNAEHEALLRKAQTVLRDRYRVAVTTGYGPRFLHSTGQLHKGGPNTGVFLQMVQPVEEDIEIPGASYTFGRLMQAQADGDLASLQMRDRRVARLSLEALAELVE
ncbi:MAG: glucose-6-phosphate isomerase [Dehalococcoidia bacterium]|nr:glucose-6-phosphate isomerase [Dehalococcoidia bacterium]